MIRKVPIIASSAWIGDIAYALRRSFDPSIFTELKTAISGHAGGRYVYTTNSGISAFYIILKALSKGSRRTEVVLPAYTAGSLVVAVRKAGLKPVLCDVSLKDFNGDSAAMIKAVSDKTLAIVCVHMFGVTMSGTAELKEKLPPEVVMIEDCAQAMGSFVGGKLAGNFGDVSFFSFNRGKNLPVCGGGCITTNSAEPSGAISQTAQALAGGRGPFNPAAFFKTVAFSIASNPYLYGAFYGLISRFKETAPPLDFAVRGMDGFQTALALELMRRFDLMAAKRYENGMLLINGLKDTEDIIVPSVPAPDKPAFNRFPIVFKDRDKLPLAAARLWRAGIESSRMYLRPLHHMFDLGYAKEDFPNACYVAQQLLALPVHPSVSREELLRAVDIIRGATR